MTKIQNPGRPAAAPDLLFPASTIRWQLEVPTTPHRARVSVLLLAAPSPSTTIRPLHSTLIGPWPAAADVAYSCTAMWGGIARLYFSQRKEDVFALTPPPHKIFRADDARKIIRFLGLAPLSPKRRPPPTEGSFRGAELPWGNMCHVCVGWQGPQAKMAPMNHGVVLMANSWSPRGLLEIS